MKDIFLYGAGGHARVIIDIIEKMAIYKLVGLVDDTGSDIPQMMGYPIVSDFGKFYSRGIRSGVIAVGDNWSRSRLVDVLTNKYNDLEFLTAVHPSSRIGRDTVIGVGTVIMAGCNVNTKTRIGNHCIINTGSNVDHDCQLGDYSSLAPGVTLGGNVIVGNYSAVCLGASVIQGIKISSHAVIGAGSVVVSDIGPNCVAYGNPCKQIRTRQVDSPYL
jgi:sugar O-acyltransferase (sialic acid O-acetyltransferase NeuD family)